MWVRTRACFAQKKSFWPIVCQRQAGLFFVEVFIEVWPWENIGGSGASVEFGSIVNLLYESLLIFDKIFAAFVCSNLILFL